MSGKWLSNRITGEIHEQTQLQDAGYDLTVAEILHVRQPGAIDFGGSELEPAKTAGHRTDKRDPEDDHGWWELGRGTYLIEYNEELGELGDRKVLLQPRDELLDRGAWHPTLAVTELPRIPLSVPGPGIRIKQNARVSTLVPL